MAAEESKKKLVALSVVVAVLAAVLAWVYWPKPVPVDAEAQKALEALNSNKDANPPVADVPPPAEPRRKATKGN